MVPLLAPLLGSLAGSLLPASVGTGIAGALGLKGATAGLVAAAAPKAIGAGIGTLLAGGDLGDAALNAVGFGAGGALVSQLRGAGMQNAGAEMPAPAPAPQPMGAMAPTRPMMRPTAPMAGGAGADVSVPQTMEMAQQIPSVVPQQPPAAGLASFGLPNMTAGMGPDQSNMVNQYLRSQNMVGFV